MDRWGEAFLNNTVAKNTHAHAQHTISNQWLNLNLLHMLHLTIFKTVGGNTHTHTDTHTDTQTHYRTDTTRTHTHANSQAGSRVWALDTGWGGVKGIQLLESTALI